jgi:cell division protease FtsH
LVYGEESGQAFMGHPGAQGSSVSSNIAHLIDEEVRDVIDRNYQRAEILLQENINVLHKMADALMKWETIDRPQIEDLMAGKEPRSPVINEVILQEDIKPAEINDKPEDKVDGTSTKKKMAKQV